MTLAYDLMLVALVLLAAVATGGVVLRARSDREPLVTLELAARDGASADLANWTRLFERLHGIERHGWRGRLYGRPWLAIELWAEQGTVGVRWVVPADLEPVVRALVEASLPGIAVVAGD